MLVHKARERWRWLKCFTSVGPYGYVSNLVPLRNSIESVEIEGLGHEVRTGLQCGTYLEVTWKKESGG